MSARWGMPMARTMSAEFINPPMAARIGRRFSIRDSEIGVSDLGDVRPQPNFCLPAHGTRGVRRGARMLRSMARAAAFIVRRMAARPGRRSTATACPRAIGDASGVDVAPDGKRVYALIVSDSGQDRGLAFIARTMGAIPGRSPTPIRALTSRAWYFNRITIDPQNPDVIYMPNVALYRSEDGGKTISVVRGAPGGDDYHQLWIDPKNSSSMVLGTDQGTTISLDRGQTWSTWYNQPTAQLYHVITDDQFPYVVYGAQQDSGSAAVLSRTDHGQITPRDWFPPRGSESGYMVLDPKDPNIIYLSGAYGSVTRFNRSTGLSQDITPWPAWRLMRRSINASIVIPGRRRWFVRRLTRRTVSRNAICDEDDRRRPALANHQSRFDWTTRRKRRLRQLEGPPTLENAKGDGLRCGIHDCAITTQSLIWSGREVTPD